MLYVSHANFLSNPHRTCSWYCSMSSLFPMTQRQRGGSRLGQCAPFLLPSRNACRRNCQSGTRARRGLHRYWKSRELAAARDTACAEREHLAPRLKVGSVSCFAGYRSSGTTLQEPDGLVQGSCDPLSERTPGMLHGLHGL